MNASLGVDSILQVSLINFSIFCDGKIVLFKFMFDKDTSFEMDVLTLSCPLCLKSNCTLIMIPLKMVIASFEFPANLPSYFLFLLSELLYADYKYQPV